MVCLEEICNSFQTKSPKLLIIIIKKIKLQRLCCIRYTNCYTFETLKRTETTLGLSKSYILHLSKLASVVQNYQLNRSISVCVIHRQMDVETQSHFYIIIEIRNIYFHKTQANFSFKN